MLEYFEAFLMTNVQTRHVGQDGPQHFASIHRISNEQFSRIVKTRHQIYQVCFDLTVTHNDIHFTDIIPKAKFPLLSGALKFTPSCKCFPCCPFRRSSIPCCEVRYDFPLLPIVGGYVLFVLFKNVYTVIVNNINKMSRHLSS